MSRRRAHQRDMAYVRYWAFCRRVNGWPSLEAWRVTERLFALFRRE